MTNKTPSGAERASRKYWNREQQNSQNVHLLFLLLLFLSIFRWASSILSEATYYDGLCTKQQHFTLSLLAAWIFGYPRGELALSVSFIQRKDDSVLAQMPDSMILQLMLCATWVDYTKGKTNINQGSLLPMRTDFCCSVMAKFSSNMHLLLKKRTNK